MKTIIIGEKLAYKPKPAIKGYKCKVRDIFTLVDDISKQTNLDEVNNYVQEHINEPFVDTLVGEEKYFTIPKMSIKPFHNASTFIINFCDTPTQAVLNFLLKLFDYRSLKGKNDMYFYPDEVFEIFNVDFVNRQFSILIDRKFISFDGNIWIDDVHYGQLYCSGFSWDIILTLIDMIDH